MHGILRHSLLPIWSFTVSSSIFFLYLSYFVLLSLLFSPRPFSHSLIGRPCHASLAFWIMSSQFFRCCLKYAKGRCSKKRAICKFDYCSGDWCMPKRASGACTPSWLMAASGHPLLPLHQWVNEFRQGSQWNPFHCGFTRALCITDEYTHGGRLSTITWSIDSNKYAKAFHSLSYLGPPLPQWANTCLIGDQLEDTCFIRWTN